MILQYNTDVERIKSLRGNGNQIRIEEIITKDETKIKWVQNLVKDAEKGIIHSYDKSFVRIVSYRPFTKEFLYFN